MTVRVVGHDHVVFRVADGERSAAWYRDVLGLTLEREDQWRAGEVPFLSVRVDPTTVIDLLEVEPRDLTGGVDRSSTNVDHVALVVESGTDLQAVADSGRFDVVSGPRWIWGAQGHGWGLYVRDPDGNIIELKVYAESDGDN